MPDEVADSNEKMTPAPNISAEELRRCSEILNAIVDDRGVLANLPLEDRKRLLSAAGRVSRPGRAEERRLRRTFKKIQKHERTIR